MCKKDEIWRRLVAVGGGSGNAKPKQWLASEIAKRMGLNLKREEHRKLVKAIQQKLARNG